MDDKKLNIAFPVKWDGEGGGLYDEAGRITRVLADRNALGEYIAEAINEKHERRWLPLNRENSSLRWVLMRDNKGVEGIRLGRPEEGGWRLVDEFGKSTWQPHRDDYYLAEMPLFVPKGVPYNPKGE